MKNIHVLATDKLSRLHYYNSYNGIVNYGLSKEYLQWSQDRHIYITNNEEIKSTDYYLDITLNIVMKGVYFESSDKKGKKIILTDDPELIKDGVQKIDDAFLEWFVKNPSCEFVEVKSYKIDKVWDELHTQFNPIYPMKIKYKIIISSEDNGFG